MAIDINQLAGWVSEIESAQAEIADIQKNIDVYGKETLKITVRVVSPYDEDQPVDTRRKSRGRIGKMHYTYYTIEAKDLEDLRKGYDNALDKWRDRFGSYL